MVHCDGADGGDFFWGDDGGFVAEGVADVGKDGGYFLVLQTFEGSHGDEAGVACAIDFDGAVEAMKSELDESFFVTL